MCCSSTRWQEPSSVYVRRIITVYTLKIPHFCQLYFNAAEEKVSMRVPRPALWLCLLHLGNPRESNQALYLEAAGAIPKGRVLRDNWLTAPGTACQLMEIFPLRDQSTGNQDDLLWYFPDAASSKLQRDAWKGRHTGSPERGPGGATGTAP